VFTGNTGLDPYTTAASDLYQDLFGEGSYYGKGIYDVDAFQASLDGRVPENRLLSHDLFEGVFARVGLASDIELLDDYPSGYSVYAARQHRWVRGDWQLAPWLLPRVPWVNGRRASDLPLLGRWKLLDNLRRSLLAPAVLALLVAGLTVLPGAAWAWVVFALSGIVLPVFAHLATPLIRADDGAWTSYVRGHWSSFRTDLLQVAISLALLPEQALQDLDAITRTLVRLLVTRRNLLEWETAAEAERRATTNLAAMWRSMLAGPALGVTMLGLVTLTRPGALPLALPLVLLWLASAFIAYWMSQPLRDRRQRPLPADDQRFLRRTARKTWRFFEMFVTADDNWLPPDNYQEDPKGVLARRTSPTNIGLYLLSVLAARDFGYITLTDFASRIEQTLDTLERLDRYRGHFYNWYDTAKGQPLQPASRLWTAAILSQACWRLLQAAVRPSGRPWLGRNCSTPWTIRLGCCARASTRVSSRTQTPLSTLWLLQWQTRALRPRAACQAGGCCWIASPRCSRTRRRQCCASRCPLAPRMPTAGMRAWTKPHIGRAAFRCCSRRRLGRSTFWLPVHNTSASAAAATTR
jgi:cyclic beta-1,2-glucan synthetase